MLPRAKDLPELYPGIAPRFLALLIDCIPVGIATSLLVGLAEALHVHFDYGGALFCLLGCPYWALFESSSWQATPGKRALGIVVVDAAGARIRPGRAAGRYLAKFLSAAVFLIGFLVTDFTPRRQALHDYVSATFVVRRKPLAAWAAAGSPQSPPAALTVRSIGGIVGNIVLLSIVAGFGYLCYRMISNSDALRSFCASVRPGTTRVQLQAAVQGSRLRETYYHDNPQAGSAIVVVPGTYPPNQCYVEFDGDQVKSAGYVPFN